MSNIKLVPKQKKLKLKPISAVLTDDEKARFIAAINKQTSIADAIRQLILEFIKKAENPPGYKID